MEACSNAFRNVDGLTSIKFPQSIGVIVLWPFDNCLNLQIIRFKEKRVVRDFSDMPCFHC